MHCERFRSPHYDAVSNDETNKNRQTFGDIIRNRLQKLINHYHQRSDDRHLHDDTNIRWNVIANQRDANIRHGGNEYHGQAHDNGGRHTDRHRQSRTNS